MDSKMTYHRHRSVFGPLLLVTIGFFFLLNNLGVVTGSFWDLVFRLWPVLLIVGGLDDLFQRRHFIGPVFWISVGAIILLANLGIVQWDLWDLAIRFWPVLIIVAGLDIILSRYVQNVWGILLSLILVVGMLLGILWYAEVYSPVGKAVQSETVTQPIGNATRANIHLSPATGSIRVHSVTTGKDLVSGNTYTNASEQVEHTASSSGNVITYSLTSRGFTSSGSNSNITIFPGWGYSDRNHNPSWNIGLNAAVPMDLGFTLGAGNANLDLTSLQLSKLSVQVAVGQSTITLPSNGNFSASIDNAIGQTILVIPQNTPVRIEASHGIASYSYPSGYSRQDDVLTSANYSESPQHINVQINQAIGSLVIRNP